MASLSVYNHGGGCCGMTHIRGFSNFKASDVKRLESIVSNTSKPHNFRPRSSMLVEAVVTNNQLKLNPTLKSALKKTGFRCVSRFKNRNSGNICYVYHNYTKV